MAASPCWPRDTLKDYLNGSADDQRLTAIESHLAQCQVCEQTLVELERDPDTLLASVREQARESNRSESQAKSDSGNPPSVVERAVEAVKRLGAAPSASSVPLEKSSQIRLQQIGAYELLRPLGRGGMGLVMLARHSTLKKQVAIKILPSLIGDRPELVQRFQREIVTAGGLNHPSIVHATDAGAEQGTHYLVMEYIDGLDLSRLARLGGPLGIADACELTRQTALGLSYAHAQGVVHRDIKPSNLMLDTAGRVKILDFGLAQLNLWEEAAVELTTVGQLMGTLDYMAPEQAERAGPVDYRADLYALGATLFRLLTGRAPLAASPHMTLLEKVRLLGSQSPPRVSTLREDCPTQLVQLIEQLLARDPMARPASAAHVAESLLPFCSGHEVVPLLERCREQAEQDGALEHSATAPATHVRHQLGPAQEPVSPTPPLSNKWSFGRRVFVGLALAALAPIAIFAGILLTLETQKGQLVIESDVAGIKVNVLQNGKVYEQLQVQTGAQVTRLLADKYSIEIDGASDGVAIDRSIVEIRRGATVVARIEQKAKEAQVSSIPNAQDIAAPFIYSRSRADRRRGEHFVGLNRVMSLDLHDMPLGSALISVSEETHIDYVFDVRLKNDLGRILAQPVKLRAPEPMTVREMLNSLLAQCDLDYEFLGGGVIRIVKDQSAIEDPDDVLILSPTSPADANQPEQMYGGRTLTQWLDVLERDLDSQTREAALPPIVELARGADEATRSRINRALVVAIISESEKAYAYAGDRDRIWMRKSPGVLVNGLTSINGLDKAFEILSTQVFVDKQGNVTEAAFKILLGKDTNGRFEEVTDPRLVKLAGPWLMQGDRFQQLNKRDAWHALTFIENGLGDSDTAFIEALPKLILEHPQLGLRGLLVLRPPADAPARAELTALEESIARSARDAFLSDDSTPEIVALSAARLALTTPLVETFRPELVAKLDERLKALSQNLPRLLDGFHVGQEGVRAGGASDGLLAAIELHPPGASNGRIETKSSYIGSEIMCMLALIERLKAVTDLETSLAEVASQVTEVALPLAVAIKKLPNDSRSPVNRSQTQLDREVRWPFDSQQIARCPASVASFPLEAWRAVKIAASLQATRTQPGLFHTRFFEIVVGYEADLIIEPQDKDGDHRISFTERDGISNTDFDQNGDKFATREEVIQWYRQYAQYRFVQDLFKLDRNGDRKLSKADAVPVLSEATFEEIDVNKDDWLSVEECANYRLNHPELLTRPQETSTTVDMTMLDWAKRQIDKYDKNKDGMLTEVEWQAMIRQPKPGTDANNDGKITPEELAASQNR